MRCSFVLRCKFQSLQFAAAMSNTEAVMTHRVNEKSGSHPNEKSGITTEHVEYAPDSKKGADLNVLERHESDTSLSSLHSDEKVYTKPPDTARDLVQEVLRVEDASQADAGDSTIPPLLPHNSYTTWILPQATSGIKLCCRRQDNGSRPHPRPEDNC